MKNRIKKRIKIKKNLNSENNDFRLMDERLRSAKPYPLKWFLIHYDTISGSLDIIV